MSLSPKIAQACFKRDGWKCRHCSNRAGLHPHHVIFKSHGGTDNLCNLLTLCNCCHLQGVHEGRLLIEVLELLPDNLKVRFIRKNNWKPT